MPDDMKLLRARLRVFVAENLFEPLEQVFAKFKETLAPTAKMFKYDGERFSGEDVDSAGYNCVLYLKASGDTMFYLMGRGGCVTARVHQNKYWLDEDESGFGE